jgi:hypothetical protein
MLFPTVGYAVLPHRPYRRVVSLPLGDDPQSLSSARQLRLFWALDLALRSAAGPHLDLQRSGCTGHSALRPGPPTTAIELPVVTKRVLSTLPENGVTEMVRRLNFTVVWRIL